MKEIRSKHFTNGSVYALHLDDGMPIEVTDTFLPEYTKNCINGTNAIQDSNLGSRAERWMIGVSTMSGCPVRCKFCATGKLKKWRNLTAAEIVAQVEFVINKNLNYDPLKCFELKCNYTRCGEPMLNLDAVKEAIGILSVKYPNMHHYVSTIGISGMDTSWIKGNITLQLSLHSLDETRRNELIPYKKKMTIAELGAVRTKSNLKTTLNMTLVDTADFDIEKLQKHFDPGAFFIKLSPININSVSEANGLGTGVIKTTNLI